MGRNLLLIAITFLLIFVGCSSSQDVKHVENNLEPDDSSENKESFTQEKFYLNKNGSYSFNEKLFNKTVGSFNIKLEGVQTQDNLFFGEIIYSGIESSISDEIIFLESDSMEGSIDFILDSFIKANQVKTIEYSDTQIYISGTTLFWFTKEETFVGLDMDIELSYDELKPLLTYLLDLYPNNLEINSERLDSLESTNFNDYFQN